MKKVTVNGHLYLGDVSEKDGVVVIKNAMSVRKINRQTISEYMKKKNLDELEEITFSGMGTSVSKSKMSDEEELTFDICERAMKYAEKKAQSGMINTVFEETLGKF